MISDYAIQESVISGFVLFGKLGWEVSWLGCSRLWGGFCSEEIGCWGHGTSSASGACSGEGAASGSGASSGHMASASLSSGAVGLDRLGAEMLELLSLLLLLLLLTQLLGFRRLGFGLAGSCSVAC